MLQNLSFRAHPQFAILVRRAYAEEKPGWHAFCREHCKCSFHDASPFVAYELMLMHIEGQGVDAYPTIGEG